MKNLLAFLCALLLVACASTGEGVSQSSVAKQRHFLWKVSDGDSHVWILVSVVSVDSSFYPCLSEISNA